MAKMYVPDNIPQEYHFLGNMTNTYFDLYNTNNPRGQTVQYYRVFYSYDDNFSLQYQQTYGSYQDYNFPTIERTTSVFSNTHCVNYMTIAFIICFLIVFIANQITSIVKRGGIFANN